MCGSRKVGVLAKCFSRLCIAQRAVLTSLEKQLDPRGSEAVFARKSIVTCEFPGLFAYFQERFKLRVGYGRFVEVLKRLGQPSMELLKSVLNLVSSYF